MKLIGLMSLTTFKDQIRKVFEKHQIQIYSEVDVTGHTTETIEQYGWWHLEKDLPAYSTLYFAILADEKAAAIMRDIETTFGNQDDIQFKPRAFQVAVEKMI